MAAVATEIADALNTGADHPTSNGQSTEPACKSRHPASSQTARSKRRRAEGADQQGASGEARRMDPNGELMDSSILSRAIDLSKEALGRSNRRRVASVPGGAPHQSTQ